MGVPRTNAALALLGRRPRRAGSRRTSPGGGVACSLLGGENGQLREGRSQQAGDTDLTGAETGPSARSS